MIIYVIDIISVILHLEMNAAAINRKVELCRELLTVADVIDGGWSIFRGQLLLDLQEALAIQARQQYLNGLLTRDGAQVITFIMSLFLINLNYYLTNYCMFLLFF